MHADPDAFLYIYAPERVVGNGLEESRHVGRALRADALLLQGLLQSGSLKAVATGQCHGVHHHTLRQVAEVVTPMARSLNRNPVINYAYA